MQEPVAVLLSIAAIWFAATVVPGPDFLVITRVALAGRRGVGLRGVLGVACGTAVWGLAGCFGIHALFAAAPWMHIALKIGGGAWLLFLGVRLIAGSFAHRTPSPAGPPALSAASAFRTGLVTNLANPKAALFTASLFAATMPPDRSLALGLGAAGIMTAIALTWYGALVCVLTTRRAASGFRKMRGWIDRLSGLALIGFGGRLALDR